MTTISFENKLRDRSIVALDKRDLLMFAAILAFGIAIRLILMAHPGYTYDVDYFFRPWADFLGKVSLSDAYRLAPKYGIDIDYPPLYLYVVDMLGAFARSVGIPLDYTAASTRFLFKYPALLADISIAILVFHIARKHFRSSAAIWVSAFFLFNPALMYNSAVWGQIDSILVLFALLSLYLLVTNRFMLATIIFTLGLTFKPHMLFIAPVFVTVLFLNAKYWKALLAIPVSIITLVAVVSPFAGTLNPVSCISFFARILGSMEGKYQNLSMNMWNFWQSLGRVLVTPDGKTLPDTAQIVSDLPDSMQAYVPSFHTVGLILIGIMTVFVVILLLRRRNEGTVFLAGAIMFLGVSLLGTRMHERYPLPAVMLMGIVGFYYAGLRPLYYLLTLLHLINIHAVLSAFLSSLRLSEPEKYQFLPNQLMMSFTNHPVIIQIVTILFFISFVIMLIYLWIAVFGTKACEDEKRLGWLEQGFFASLIADIRGSADKAREFLTAPFFNRHPWTRGLFVQYRSEIAINRMRLDWVEDIVDWFFCTFSAKYKKERLQTLIQMKRDDPDFEFEAATYSEPGGFRLFLRHLSAYMPDPSKIGRVIPFKWFSNAFKSSFPVHRFSKGDAFLLLFLTITTAVIYFYNYGVPEYLYFDEEYFAKTAYQFSRLEELYPNVGFPWETTHPHMGKLMQAAFIKLFGFTPMGYRLPNLIFGVLTIPFLYLLARDVLRSRRTGFFAAFFFMLCGLSFSQARLCTIDAPAVFFMVLSFFCFYKYFSGLWPKLPALACTSIAIGLAIATKWTSVFAMAMLLFLMFWRETAMLFAPVHSGSFFLKNIVCRWFSSRAFDIGSNEEFLLDPMEEEINGTATAQEVAATEAEPDFVAPSDEQPALVETEPANSLSYEPLGGPEFVQPRKGWKDYLLGLGILVLFLIIVPLFIYSISFVRLIQTHSSNSQVVLNKRNYESNLPGRMVWWYFTETRKSDPGLTSVKVETNTLDGVFALAIDRSRDMFAYHASVGKEENYKPHPYESRWFHWPLLLKLIWYDSWSSAWQGYPTKRVMGAVAIGNPLLFWFGLPCILFLIWGAIEERRIGLLFVAVGFSFLYLPWVISPRQVTFLYHYLPAQPFLCMGIAYTMEDFWEDRLTRWLSILFIVAVVAVFLYFYPWLNDMSLSERSFLARQWSGSWGVGY